MEIFVAFSEKLNFNCEFKKSLNSIVHKTMTVHYFCGQLILKVITSEGIFNLSLNFSTWELPPNSLHFLCVKQGMYIKSRSTYLPDERAVGFKKIWNFLSLVLRDWSKVLNQSIIFDILYILFTVLQLTSQRTDQRALVCTCIQIFSPKKPGFSPVKITSQ